MEKELISDEYKALLQKMHERGSFGSGSGKHREKIKKLGYRDILDYGCGKGKLDVPQRYDPAMKEFSKEPVPADLVVCTDVMEHIEPEFLDNVLSHIKSLAKQKAWFVISCRDARKTLPDGRNAHIIVRPPAWWLEKLSQYFTIKSYVESETELEVLCEADAGIVV